MILLAWWACSAPEPLPPAPAPPRPAPAPAPPPPPPTAVELALGEHTSCARWSDHRTTCVGVFALGGAELVGRLEVDDQGVCARVPGEARCVGAARDERRLTPFLEVVRGPGAPCARDADGNAWCFRIDTPDETTAELVAVPLPAAAVQLGADGARIYARLADDTLWSWAPVGHGTDPAPVRVLTGVTTVDDQPWSELCAATAEAVRCFSTGRALAPHRVAGAVAVAVGRTHRCALAAGRVTCWGGDPEVRAPPALVAPTALDAGYDHTCALDGGRPVCWGVDRDGQLGLDRR